MKWSFSVGRIAGIRVYVHFTFLILLGWIAISYGVQSGSLERGLTGMALFASIAVIIVLHELGHALAARRFGIRTRDITLLPIGGIARLERMPDKPKQELIVALAGPLVNLVLAAGLFIGLLIMRGTTGWLEAIESGGTLADQLLWVNVSLAFFNLLPAFPMDGGRVLRALLAMVMDYVEATRVAATIGQIAAVGFGLLGLVTMHPILFLIALFVWTGAEAEAEMVRTRFLLAGVPVRRVMTTQFDSLSPTDTLADAAHLATHGFQQDFPVVDAGRLEGILTRQNLVDALSAEPTGEHVERFMRPDVPAVHPHDTLETAFSQLQRCECLTIPVVENGSLVGLLTADQVGRFVMLRDKMRHPKREHLSREVAAAREV